ncbi:MAG: hypothetical protein ACFE8V_06830, partial [Promethearchaeota archaeon]
VSFMLYDDFSSKKKEFKEKLRWFEEEFKQLFGNKTHLASKEDMELANDLLDRLSEVINQYQEVEFLDILNETLNRIEKKYPELFLELKDRGI